MESRNISPDVESTITLYRDTRKALLPVIEESGITDEVYELVESRSLMLASLFQSLYSEWRTDAEAVLEEMIAWRRLLPRNEKGERRGSADVHQVCQGDYQKGIPYVPSFVAIG